MPSQRMERKRKKKQAIIVFLSTAEFSHLVIVNIRGICCAYSFNLHV